MEIEVARVYGASKFEQKITEAPSSVSIVTANEIKKYGWRSLAEILRSVRGVFVTNDRNYSYLGVRGFGRPGDYNSRILLLIDGHRVNDNIYDSLLLGNEFILDVDLIDRIEFTRGPGSSLYGSNAFFASIHVITRPGKSINGLEASTEAGSLKTYKGRLTYGNKFLTEMEMLLSGSFYSSGGNERLYFREYDSPSSNHGLAERVDREGFCNIFSTVSFKDFKFQGGWNKREKTIPTGYYGTDFNHPGNQTLDGRAYLDLKYQRGFKNGTDVTARIFYDYYQYKGDYLYSGVVNKDSSLGQWWGIESRINKTFFEKHKVILGLEYTNNLRQDQKNYNQEPYRMLLEDKRSSWNGALYIQDEYSIIKNLILNAGIRYDYFKTFGGAVNPRLALIFNPLEKTFFKLLYGTAFRTPNVFELYYHDLGNTSKPNPDLKKETITTYELIWEQYLGKYLRGHSSLYYYRINDLISQTIDPEDGLMVYQNIDKTEAKGLELGLEIRGLKGVEAKASYAWQEAINQVSGEELTNSPKHLARVGLSIPLLQKKIFFSPELRYMGRRKTLGGNATGGFLTMNATLLLQNLIPGLEISGGVYNLGDQSYGDPGGAEHRQDIIQQDGRTFRLKVTYRF
ncbi:MAG: TonB-dependent receptor [Thermodesulfobacteriota bacterium]